MGLTRQLTQKTPFTPNQKAFGVNMHTNLTPPIPSPGTLERTNFKKREGFLSVFLKLTPLGYGWGHDLMRPSTVEPP